MNQTFNLTYELSASTGNPQVDALLRGLVGIYQTVFPQGVRCLYVVGSYSDGSAVPGSDLDVGVVFNTSLTEDHMAQFRQITQSLALISPVRLDCGTVNPKRFINGIPAGLKAASVMYGENVFAELPLEPLEQALRRGMSNTFHSLYVLRQRDDRLVSLWNILIQQENIMAMSGGVLIWVSGTLARVYGVY